MKNILLIHGANLNLLGQRDHHLYGHLTLQDIEALTATEAKKYGYSIIAYQSNHEGAILDKLQQESRNSVAIIINPGAFAHYSFSLHDALLDSKLPAIEVHLSKLGEREPWRKHSVTKAACIAQIDGKKQQGYIEAVKLLAEHLSHEN